jgi:hypothetical protein
MARVLRAPIAAARWRLMPRTLLRLRVACTGLLVDGMRNARGEHALDTINATSGLIGRCGSTFAVGSTKLCHPLAWIAAHLSQLDAVPARPALFPGSSHCGRAGSPVAHCSAGNMHCGDVLPGRFLAPELIRDLSGGQAAQGNADAAGIAHRPAKHLNL